jgi:polar amino acid transport system substrate-binding protein
MICMEEAPPLNHLGPDGAPAGLVVDIVREIQRRLGNADPIQVVPWVRGLAFLDEGSNVLLFSMARTAQRDPLYQWIGPVYESAFALFSLKAAGISAASIEAAKRVRAVGVYRGDVRDTLLSALGFTNLYRTDSEPTLARMLFARRLDLIASSSVGIRALMESIGRSVDEVEFQLEFSRVQLYIAASKKMDPGIVRNWNAALEGMKKDGAFRRAFEAYGLAGQLPGSEVIGVRPVRPPAP